MKQTKQLDKVCRQKELLTKCPSHTSCSCSLKHKKSKYSRKSFKQFKPRYSKKKTYKRSWKYLRKKRKFEKTSNRYHLCGHKGHFAKQYPKGKTVKLISHIQEVTKVSLLHNYVESNFSLDEEEITPETVYAIHPSSDFLDSSDWTGQEDEAIELYKLSFNQYNVANADPQCTSFLFKVFQAYQSSRFL